MMMIIMSIFFYFFTKYAEYRATHTGHVIYMGRSEMYKRSYRRTKMDETTWET